MRCPTIYELCAESAKKMEANMPPRIADAARRMWFGSDDVEGEMRKLEALEQKKSHR